MNAVVKLRDPTPEAAAVQRTRKAAPSDLAGKTVGLLDIGKMRGAEYIDRLVRGTMTFALGPKADGSEGAPE